LAARYVAVHHDRALAAVCALVDAVDSRRQETLEALQNEAARRSRCRGVFGQHHRMHGAASSGFSALNRLTSFAETAPP
jgi:hypothetical protein